MRLLEHHHEYRMSLLLRCPTLEKYQCAVLRRPRLHTNQVLDISTKNIRTQQSPDLSGFLCGFEEMHEPNQQRRWSFNPTPRRSNRDNPISPCREASDTWSPSRC